MGPQYQDRLPEPGDDGRMSEFAEVLRAWRDRVRPAEVGLPAGPGRRTAGLRREELATLAGVSVDYVVRLEQGRATNPSPQLLGALATALRLTEAERDHLFRVAGAAVPSRARSPATSRPACTACSTGSGTSRWPCSRRRTTSCCGTNLWATVSGDPGRWTGLEANLVWRHFTQGHDGVEWDEHPTRRTSRATWSPTSAPPWAGTSADRRLAELVARLRRASPEFERRWHGGRIAEHRTGRKVVHTPVGRWRSTATCSACRAATCGSWSTRRCPAARTPRSWTCSGSRAAGVRDTRTLSTSAAPAPSARAAALVTRRSRSGTRARRACPRLLCVGSDRLDRHGRALRQASAMIARRLFASTPLTRTRDSCFAAAIHELGRGRACRPLSLTSSTSR